MVLGYDEKSIERLRQENGRMAGQLQEAISIVKDGTDYEKMHLLGILKDGVPKCHLCNDTGYNSVSGDHAMLGDFCSCQKGVERHWSYEASWEPWDVIVRKSSDMGVPTWVCAPIRQQKDLSDPETEDPIQELPVEQYFSEREARVRGLTWERELNWEGMGITRLYLTRDELTAIIKFHEEHFSADDMVQLLLHQLQNSELED
jgi:hypothetical protein